MKVLVLLSLLVFKSAYASQVPKSVVEIEKIFQSELKNKKLNNQEKFFIYNLAGRELYNYKFYDKSFEYYQKAINLDVAEDKTEAHINLMAIEYSKSKVISKNTYDEALKYFKRTKKNSAGLMKYMSFIDSSFFSKDGTKDYQGFYGEFAKDSSIKDLISKKKFKEALSLINPERMDERDLVTKIRYDLLRSIILGKKELSLSCKSKLDNFPHSIAWTIRVCKILVKFQNGENINKNDINKAKQAAIEQNSSHIYIIDLIGDLK